VRLFVLLSIFIIGAGLGLGLTWLASSGGNGFGAVQNGAWTSWPKSGTADADPYARASYARSGELPIELSDGILFLATADDAGHALDGRCDIRVSGRLPPARLWTLTLNDARGRLIDNPAERYGFTSSEVVWNADGSLDLVAAPRARPGNWLPTGARERVALVLRLYDVPVGVGARTSGHPQMPSIRQERCP
jgi:hypothetical protein